MGFYFIHAGLIRFLLNAFNTANDLWTASKLAYKASAKFVLYILKVILSLSPIEVLEALERALLS